MHATRPFVRTQPGAAGTFTELAAEHTSPMWKSLRDRLVTPGAKWSSTHSCDNIRVLWRPGCLEPDTSRIGRLNKSELEEPMKTPFHANILFFRELCFFKSKTFVATSPYCSFDWIALISVHLKVGILCDS